MPVSDVTRAPGRQVGEGRVSSAHACEPRAPFQSPGRALPLGPGLLPEVPGRGQERSADARRNSWDCLFAWGDSRLPGEWTELALTGEDGTFPSDPLPRSGAGAAGQCAGPASTRRPEPGPAGVTAALLPGHPHARGCKEALDQPERRKVPLLQRGRARGGGPAPSSLRVWSHV